MDETIHIENFEILDVLGHGGMSTVWRARQRSLDRLVAIKVLSPVLATDAADVARFHAEATAAARLKHPGIVQVYDAGMANGSYYFVMELIDGYTVGEWVRRKGRLSEADALVLAECIATALDYAWTQFGMIHCDIKPDNIMIDADGSVKITDLGLVRTLSTLSHETSDEVMGTPAYMSPEQVSGESTIDCRADIYALGAMLYRLVTGHLLFENETEERQMVLQVEGVVPDPAEICPDLSASFCALITRMLVKDRHFRHADWKAFLQDLQRVKKQLPLPPMPRHVLSTVKHHPQRMRAPTVVPHAVHESAVQRRAAHHRRSLMLGAGLVAMLLLFWLWRSASRPGRSAPRPAAVAFGSADAAGAALRQAREWEAANAEDAAGAARRYRYVANAWPGTDIARQARAAEAACMARLAAQADADTGDE